MDKIETFKKLAKVYSKHIDSNVIDGKKTLILYPSDAESVKYFKKLGNIQLSQNKCFDYRVSLEDMKTRVVAWGSEQYPSYASKTNMLFDDEDAANFLSDHLINLLLQNNAFRHYNAQILTRIAEISREIKMAALSEIIEKEENQ